MQNNRLLRWTASGLLLSGGLLLASCGGPWRHYHHFNPERILAHIDHEVKELNLNADQKKKYQEIRARVKADMESSIKERREFMKGIEERLDQKNPDMDHIIADLKKRSEEHPAHFAKALDSFKEFYGILDEKQKEQVVKEIRSHLKRFADN